MRLIKRKTIIPVPEVYVFESFINNTIGCPFILMQYIQGRPLFRGWFETPEKEREAFRKTALKDIAQAMVQLTKFTFDRGGSLVFDSRGDVVDIGPSRIMD